MAVLVGLAAVSGFAFPRVPKASAKALGMTRGKPFSTGLVFVNGKFLPPPYVVERWGTGIRINSQPVTGQVVSWTEFVKTQPNAKETTKEVEYTTTELVADPNAPAASSVSDADLDDFFEDDGGSDVGTKLVNSRPSLVRQEVKKTKTVSTFALEGPFVPNDASKALLTRVNAMRTDIDRVLRAGGFICFGDGYPQVSGDSRMREALINALPELMKDAKSLDDFHARMQAAGLGYLNAKLREDLYSNHVDYPKLQKHRLRQSSSTDLDPSLKELAEPLF